jgi:hypothetical protein
VLQQDKLRNKIKLEHEALHIIIWNIHDIAPGLTTEKLLKKLISFIAKGAQNRESAAIISKLIDLFCYFIINVEPKGKETKAKARERIQNHLNSLGMPRVILNLMCDPETTDDVFMKLVQFATKLLKGGNEAVQKEFYHYFITVSNSELLFQRINEILT